jgi:hypothetical protein
MPQLLQRLKQKYGKFKASLGDIVRSQLKNINKIKQNPTKNNIIFIMSSIQLSISRHKHMPHSQRTPSMDTKESINRNRFRGNSREH